jgi:AAA15 family ATPase/GTPase
MLDGNKEQYMLDQIYLQNYGPLQALKWSGLGQINLVLGGNGTGKSFLLKALYTAMRTLEEYYRYQEEVSHYPQKPVF